MIKKQRGYTAFELVIAAGFLVAVLGAGFTTLYVVFHFISKFW